MMAPPILEATGVATRRRDRWILTSATLGAHAGAVTALLGRNGAGKTTLLRVLVGDLSPESGTTRVDGAPLERPSRAGLARLGVCFMPARDVLHPRVSVLRQLTWIAASAVQLETTLAQLTLLELGDQRPAALSGGERRRAELAAALLCAPRVLVLDEPLRGIAPLDAALLLSALRTFARQGGAVILTAHEWPLLEGQIDSVVWCYAGTTRAFDSHAAAAADAQFRREFLGPRTG